MKYLKITCLLSFTIFISGLTGCTQSGESTESKESHTSKSKIILAGKIKNPQKEKVGFKKEPNGKKKAFQLNDKGVFHGEYVINEPSYLRFTHKEYTNLFAKPGDSIYLTINTKQFDETAEYSGERSNINNYMAGKILVKDSVPLMNRKNMKKLYKKAPMKFVNMVDSFHQIFKGYYQRHFQDGNVSKTFANLEKPNIDYRFYEMKLNYPRYHKRLTKKDSVQVPDQFYAFQSKTALNKPELLRAPNYRGYLETYLNKEMRNFKKNDTMDKEKSMSWIAAQVLKNEIDNKEVQAALMGKSLLKQLKYRGPENIEAGMKFYNSLPADSATKAQIKSLKKDWAKLAKGKKAPGFRYPNINGDTISLQDLRGNYVYIDAWATWCGPCRKEIPHLKKLHDELKDQNIKFVSISLDRAEDKNKWEEMVNEKGLKGIQLFANGNAFDSKLAEDYIIKGIPRFILIDQNGKIIDAEAERPSGDIKKRLESLLKEKEA